MSVDGGIQRAVGLRLVWTSQKVDFMLVNVVDNIECWSLLEFDQWVHQVGHCRWCRNPEEDRHSTCCRLLS